MQGSGFKASPGDAPSWVPTPPTGHLSCHLQTGMWQQVRGKPAGTGRSFRAAKEQLFSECRRPGAMRLLCSPVDKVLHLGELCPGCGAISSLTLGKTIWPVLTDTAITPSLSSSRCPIQTLGEGGATKHAKLRGGSTGFSSWPPVSSPPLGCLLPGPSCCNKRQLQAAWFPRAANDLVLLRPVHKRLPAHSLPCLTHTATL